MNRNTILEAMYKVIKDSLEWGVDCRSNSYGYFVDGVMAMTEEMLEKYETEEKKITEQLENFKKDAEYNSMLLEKAKEYLNDSLATSYEPAGRA